MGTAPDSELIGRTIAGEFAVESRVGGGAMAVVYKARHLALDKTVALKVMHRALAADPMFAARFHREAQMASRLDHPSSIRILDFGEEPGDLLYIAMELVVGRDLHELISDEWPLGDARVIRILSQVLSALSVAHELGIVHRDLKPENIMVVRGADDEGELTDLVKVCDFGIAKMAEPRSDPAANEGKPIATASGFVVGTPEYMAPEQARGEAIDGRADLYAVGVVLYRMLTRSLPFQAETALGVAVKHIYEEAPAPSRKVLGVSPGLEAICLKAMRKDPAQRYQTAKQMRAELRALLSKDDAAASSDPAPKSRGASPMEAALTLAAPLAPPPAPPAAAPVTASPTLRAPAPAPASSSASSPVVGAALPQAPASRPRPLGKAAAVAALALLLGLGASRFSATPASASGGVLPSATAVTVVNDGVHAPPSAPPLEPTAPLLTAPTGNGAPSSSAASAPTLTASARALPGTAVAAVDRDSGARAALAVEPASPTLEAPAAPPPAPSSAPAAGTEAPLAAPPPSTPSAAPAIDLEAARVSVTGVSTTAGLPASSVRSALSHVSFTRCYRDALRAAGSAAANASGSAALHLSIDDTGRVTAASAAGMAFFPGARACVEAAVRGLRIPNVDTGDATADVTLTFSLR
jgi:serine/threonine-protein kinase